MNKGHTFVVTGGTGGIGLEVARQLANTGACVVIVGRSEERTQRAQDDLINSTSNPEIHPFLADLSSMEEVAALATNIQRQFPSIQGLINNAALITAKRKLTDEGMERMFAVNYLAPFLLTQRLTPALRNGAPSHLINVASNAHRWAKTVDFANLQAEQKFDFRIAYGTQKLCNILHTFEFSRRHASAGITANAHHPGEVATNLGNNGPWYMRAYWKLAAHSRLSPEEGARPISEDILTPQTTGTYFERGIKVTPSDLAQDQGVAKQLWDYTEEILKPFRQA
tara:strand:- start:10862 stop:11707 length:846 start_codon:yes stop_codon:yes gene_type:complete